MRNIIRVKKLDPRAILPTRATKGAACFDVATIDDILVTVGNHYKLRTGLAFEVPDGYYLEVVPRSGLSSKGLILENSPATLDSDYRGELLLSVYLRPVMWNLSVLPDDNKGIHFHSGDRVMQCRVHRVEPFIFVEATELSETERGSNGFGSTGVSSKGL